MAASPRSFTATRSMSALLADGRAEEVPADSPEAVDANAYAHSHVLLSSVSAAGFYPPGSRPRPSWGHPVPPPAISVSPQFAPELCAFVSTACRLGNVSAPQLSARRSRRLSRRWTDAFVEAGRQRAASSRSESDGWRSRSSAISRRSRRKRLEHPATFEPADRAHLEPAPQRVSGRGSHGPRSRAGSPAPAWRRRPRFSSSASAASCAPTSARSSAIASRPLRVRDGVASSLDDASARSRRLERDPRETRRLSGLPCAARRGRFAARSPSRRRAPHRAGTHARQHDRATTRRGGSSNGARRASSTPASLSVCTARGSSPRWSS